MLPFAYRALPPLVCTILAAWGNFAHAHIVTPNWLIVPEFMNPATHVHVARQAATCSTFREGWKTHSDR